MNVGLIDVDGSKTFPNLCLMKISAYHKAKGDNVEWCFGLKHYDIVYKSKIFTDEYSKDNDFCINADKVILGGSGYGLDNKLPYEIEHTMPDYSLYDNEKFKNTAYGFLTRGCPRGCPFCIVAEKEGRKSIKVANLSEFWCGQKNIKLLDPNILACKEHESLLEQLAESGAWVDFTQGLDARLITESNAKLLKKIKVKMIHFAFDQMKYEKAVIRGLKIFKEICNLSVHKQSVYVLTNFNTTIEEDWYRVNQIEKLGYMPDVRIFDKPKLIEQAKSNPEKQLIHWLQRWANNKFLHFKTEFFDYSPRKGIIIRDFVKAHKIKI